MGQHAPPPAENISERLARIRFILLIVTLATFAVVAFIAHLGGWMTVDGVRQVVDHGGPLSPLVYLVVASVLVVIWFPRGLLSMVAGALFGIGLGSVLALLMGTIGAVGGYVLGLKLGHPFVAQRSSGRGERVLAFIRRRGFWAVLATRVCPLVPSELISVTSGSTNIPLSHFIGASLLGMAPTATLYAAFGASLLDPESRTVTWAALAGFGLLTVITAGFLVDLWRREPRAAAAEVSDGE